MKFSYLLLPCLAFTFTASAFAYSDYKYENMILVEPVCTVKSIKDGVYFGANLGYNAESIQQDINTTDTSGTVLNTNARLRPDSLLPGIFTGYGLYFDWFYIAGEIFINYSGASEHYQLDDYRSTTRVGGTYGAAILPGIKILPSTLAYLRIGAVRTDFKVSESGIIGGMDGSSTEWGNGMVIGLGLETLLYKNLSVRGEYRYLTYDSFDSQFQTRFAASSNQFDLGLIYHIG